MSSLFLLLHFPSFFFWRNFILLFFHSSLVSVSPSVADSGREVYTPPGSYNGFNASNVDYTNAFYLESYSMKLTYTIINWPFSGPLNKYACLSIPIPIHPYLYFYPYAHARRCSESLLISLFLYCVIYFFRFLFFPVSPFYFLSRASDVLRAHVSGSTCGWSTACPAPSSPHSETTLTT
jgi:hypothetical protein